MEPGARRYCHARSAREVRRLSSPLEARSPVLRAGREAEGRLMGRLGGVGRQPPAWHGRLSCLRSISGRRHPDTVVTLDSLAAKVAQPACGQFRSVVRMTS
jgi:hypothetical protein